MISSYAQTESSNANELYKWGKKYSYMDKIYSYRELGPIFKDREGFSVWHNKALRKKQSAAIFGIGSTGFLIWAAIIGAQCEIGCEVVVVPGSLGLVAGVISLINIELSHSSKIKSLEILKNSFGQSMNDIKTSPSLSLGVSANGIGLFYRF